MTGLTIAMVTSARTWRGSGVSLANIAEGLRERGHTAHVVAGDEPVVAAFKDRVFR